MLRMADSPGKFEGELKITELLWSASMDGCTTDEEISLESCGYYCMIRNPSSCLHEIQPGEFYIDVGEKTAVTKEEAEFLGNQAGVILYESLKGFVYGEYFENDDEMNECWSQIEYDMIPEEDEEEEL